MKSLERIRTALRTGTRGAAIASGYAFTLLSLIICFEVLARKFFSFSLEAVDELGGYTVAIAVSLAFSYALVESAHTRIDLFFGLLSSRAKAVLNWISAVSISAIACFVADRASSALSQSIEYKSVSPSVWQVPLWGPQSAWVVALSLFAGISLFMVLHATVLLWRDIKSLNRLYGPGAIDSELQNELDSIAMRSDNAKDKST